ncbi:MAG TPA: hypothetical protein VHE77_13225 [Dongiaceae bacterium]|nr:hypothetical protein [Dongiaceae bacterium]
MIAILTLFVGILIVVNLLVTRVDVDVARSTGAALATYVIAGVIVFWCIPLFAWSQRHRVAAAVADLVRLAEADDTAATRNRVLCLFVISFVVLFVETMLIRYAASQTRIFSYYKNIVLVGSFLGLGIGCLHGRGGRREALLALAGMIVIALFFSVAAQLLGAVLGLSTSLASSEVVLGYGIVVPASLVGVLKLAGTVHIGLYCVAVFLGVAVVFGLLGRILGQSFSGLPPLLAYSVNILGSLAGLAVFLLLSLLWAPPWIWFAVGLAPLSLWLGRGRCLRTGLALGAIAAVAVAPHIDHTIWSSYQKLVGRPVPHGYQIDISDAFYQVAFDLRPATIAALGENPMPYYDAAFAGRKDLDRVLVVGAGSGNDVAAALRAGARQVDAVEIDAAIAEMGAEHHPERPYDDPRVRLIVDDARHAFRTLPPQSYDAVVFGLLDSHTQLGTSSVRLDNYVFTQESFSAAAKLLRPGGTIILSASTSGGWLKDRYAQMLAHACGAPVDVRMFDRNSLFVCHATASDPDPSATGRAIAAPVDDWPFPYLPGRGVPLSYAVVVAMLAGAAYFWLRRSGIGHVELTAANGHMALLGAAFLLMEVYAINRLALLFGTTWLVSGVSIAAMLFEVLAANLLVGIVRFDLRPLAYVALALLLPAGWWLGPVRVLGGDTALLFGYALFLLSPVFCASVIFSSSFRLTRNPPEALGANLLGAVIGGWLEYATMATGIRFMALVALALYVLSWLCLRQWRRSAGAPLVGNGLGV